MITEKTLQRILGNQEWQDNVQFGQPRSGHPEGTIINHIQDCFVNLDVMTYQHPEITEQQRLDLSFIIYVHDAFKKAAWANVPITDPHSHASLAVNFAMQYNADPDILNMIQYHDEPFAIWRKYSEKKKVDSERLERLFAIIKDIDLFLMFCIIDGSTPGKERDKLEWLMQQAHFYREPVVLPDWIL